MTPADTKRAQRWLALKLDTAAKRFAQSRREHNRDCAAQAYDLAVHARYGNMTPKQYAFAMTLVKRADLMNDDVVKPRSRPVVDVPRLSAIMATLQKLRLNRVVLTRYSGETMIWCAYDDEHVGRIHDHQFIFAPDCSIVHDDDMHAGMLELLQALESNTDDTIARFGRLGGMCPYCGVEIVNAKHREQFGAHPPCRPFKTGSTTFRNRPTRNSDVRHH